MTTKSQKEDLCLRRNDNVLGSKLDLLVKYGFDRQQILELWEVY